MKNLMCYEIAAGTLEGFSSCLERHVLCAIFLQTQTVSCSCYMCREEFGDKFVLTILSLR